MNTSKENQMKTTSKVIESVVFAAILTCLIAHDNEPGYAIDSLAKIAFTLAQGFFRALPVLNIGD